MTNSVLIHCTGPEPHNTKIYLTNFNSSWPLQCVVPDNWKILGRVQGLEIELKASDSKPIIRFDVSYGVDIIDSQPPDFDAGGIVILMPNFISFDIKRESFITHNGLVGLAHSRIKSYEISMLSEYIFAMGFVKAVNLTCGVGRNTELAVETYKYTKMPDIEWPDKLPSWVKLSYYNPEEVEEVGTKGIIDKVVKDCFGGR